MLEKAKPYRNDRTALRSASGTGRLKSTFITPRRSWPPDREARGAPSCTGGRASRPAPWWHPATAVPSHLSRHYGGQGTHDLANAGSQPVLAPGRYESDAHQRDELAGEPPLVWSVRKACGAETWGDPGHQSRCVSAGSMDRLPMRRYVQLSMGSSYYSQQLLLQNGHPRPFTVRLK